MAKEFIRPPIPEEVTAKLQLIADQIKEQLPPGVGFALFVFHESPVGPMTSYISNCKRSAVLSGVGEYIRSNGE